MAAYPEAIDQAFGAEVDYAQLIKTYAVTNLNKHAASRYSPADVVKTERKRVVGRGGRRGCAARVGDECIWFCYAACGGGDY
jgi:hypothetical protein